MWSYLHENVGEELHATVLRGLSSQRVQIENVSEFNRLCFVAWIETAKQLLPSYVEEDDTRPAGSEVSACELLADFEV
jgi:hypothetical protein